MNEEDRAEKRELQVQHIRLSNTLGTLNDAFDTFVFLAYSCNVPQIVLYGFIGLDLDDDGDYTAFSVLGNMLKAVVPLVQFLYLSVTPARIASQTQKAREILVQQQHIWVPYDEEVNCVVREVTKKACADTCRR